MVTSVLHVVLVFLAIAPSTTKAEIREFSGPVAADSTYIHYSEGFIVAPGFIDLSGLTFETMDDDEGDYLGTYDGEEREPTNGEEEHPIDGVDDDDTDAPHDSEADGGNRLTTRRLGPDDGFDQKGSTVSFSFFTHYNTRTHARTHTEHILDPMMSPLLLLNSVYVLDTKHQQTRSHNLPSARFIG